MKTSKCILSLLVCLAMMAVCSCGDDKDTGGSNGGNGNNGSGEVYVPKEFVVKGQVEKGPFVSGSEINMQPLNQKMQAVGSTYSATITDDMGSFSFNPEEFSEPYARLSVNGYFYNEYKGSLSNGQITLQSVVDLRDKSTVNVNLLTHLKYQRVLDLIADGATFSDANAQAQEELLSAFGLQKMNTVDASQFSVAAGTDEAAALIVTSALLLGERSEAQFTEYLASLCQDFAADGQFSEANKEQMEKDKEKLAGKLKDIRQHLIDRYSQQQHTITVKDLSNFVDWDNNGTVGDEAHDPNKPVTLSQTSIEAPKEGGTYRITYNTDVKLYLSPQMEDAQAVVSPSMASLTGGYMSYNKKLTDDNTLVVTVNPTAYQDVPSSSITLYDYIGNSVATITLKQEGDPDGKFLSSYGEQLFLDLKQRLIQYPLALEELGRYIYNLNPQSPDVTVYHLDDVLTGYAALGYILGGRGYDVRNLEQNLQQALANLSEQPMGYCKTADQMARLSVDVVRFVLAQYYLSYDHYTRADRSSDAKTMLEAIINKSVYSESNPILGVDDTPIISYREVLSLYQQLAQY